jgi:hypothetical protein
MEVGHRAGHTNSIPNSSDGWVPDSSQRCPESSDLEEKAYCFRQLRAFFVTHLLVITD